MALDGRLAGPVPTTGIARWSPRRVRMIWLAGLLLEAALLGSMAAVLVRPEPPLVAQLRGTQPGAVWVLFTHSDSASPATPGPPERAEAAPVLEEDSFYTILHWPLDRPLLDGGGRVVTLPMRLWWVPVLYVGAVPLLLSVFTVAWARARRGAPRVS